MAKFKNLKGQRFGALVVVKRTEDVFSPKGKRRTFWWVRCDCGVERPACASWLSSGQGTSCGCRIDDPERLRPRVLNGLSYHPLYITWTSMVRRCTDTKDLSFKYYGGRGITICDEWLYFVEKFIEWGESHGFELGLSIDRIDNDGDYEPNNCQFVTMTEQARNKRTTRRIEWQGRNLTPKEWSEETGMNYNTIVSRLRLGWSAEDIFTQPSQNEPRLLQFGGVKKSSKEWGELLGIPLGLILLRQRHGWSNYRIFTEPVRTKVDGHYILVPLRTVEILEALKSA